MDEAVDETEMPLPSDPRTFFLGGLFGLAVLTALYVTAPYGKFVHGVYRFGALLLHRIEEAGARLDIGRSTP